MPYRGSLFLCPHSPTKGKTMRRALILCAGALLLLLPATASAITIHQHVTIDRPLGPPLIVTRVLDLPPPDSDDDGCANAQDHYNGPGCHKPPPPPVATTSPVDTAPTTTTTTTSVPATSGGCPSYMAGEASSPTAVNASSGASGCYQVLPSTAAAMGLACSDVNASSCVAAICASAGNAAWASSGATPCDYLKP